LLPLQQSVRFEQNSDVISVHGRNYIVNRHWELIEIPLLVNELRVQDVWHSFKEGNPALKAYPSHSLRLQ
jgi:hypothetical protein